MACIKFAQKIVKVVQVRLFFQFKIFQEKIKTKFEIWKCNAGEWESHNAGDERES